MTNLSRQNRKWIDDLFIDTSQNFKIDEQRKETKSYKLQNLQSLTGRIFFFLFFFELTNMEVTKSSLSLSFDRIQTIMENDPIFSIACDWNMRRNFVQRANERREIWRKLTCPQRQICVIINDERKNSAEKKKRDEILRRGILERLSSVDLAFISDLLRPRFTRKKNIYNFANETKEPGSSIRVLTYSFLEGLKGTARYFSRETNTRFDRAIRSYFAFVG